jgi:hypothetical protein
LSDFSYGLDSRLLQYGKEIGMGWKLLKESFGINKHYIQVTSEGICIGSGYVPSLVTINLTTGVLLENPTFAGFLRENYPKLLEASPDELLRLAHTPDTFASSVAVYTYENGQIIEKRCEQPGWPNTTHDGCLMYQNSFSTDKATVAAWAKRNAASAIEYARRRIAEAETELEQLRGELAGFEADQAKLEAAYPTAVLAKVVTDCRFSDSTAIS